MTRKVKVPDFFLALVVPDASQEPTAKECEELRQQTVKFWTQQLKQVYGNKMASLELSFQNSAFGSEKPEPKFNVYIEVSGDAIFSDTQAATDEDEDVFGAMVSADSEGYLVEYVRRVNSKSLFFTALEVCARRLIDNTIPGGTVKAPSFCIAFATDETAREPDSRELVEFKKKTHEQLQGHLKDAYPDTYESCDLEVKTAEANTSKPDDRFHLYLENEASATFSSDPPGPNEFFNIIMKLSTNGTDYLRCMHTIGDSTFETVVMLTIQVVGLEMPKPEELPSPPSPPPEEAEGEQEGEEEETEPDIIRNVPIFLALVLMVEPPAKAPQPTPEQLAAFEDLMHRLFYNLLQKKYPDSFVSMKLNEDKAVTKFGEGIPEERFNMCTEYPSEIRFKPHDSVPDEEELRALVFECNLSSILAHVQTLEPECFKHATEVSMRKEGDKKKKTAIKDAKFEAAIDAPLPEPKEQVAKKVEPNKPEPKKPIPKKLAPKKEEPKKPEPKKPAPKKVEPKKSEPLAPKKVEPKKPEPKKPEPKKVEPKKPEPKKLAPKKVEPKKSEPLAPKKMEPKKPEPKKVEPKKPEPKKLAPKKVEPKKPEPKKVEPKKPEPKKVEEKKSAKKVDHEQVRSSDVFIAYCVDGLDSLPTPEDFEKLRLKTHEFFVLELTKVFPKTFVELDLGIALKEFGTDKPSPKYNVYVEWDVGASFASVASGRTSLVMANTTSAQTVDDCSDLPDPVQITQALLKDADYFDYLVRFARTVDESCCFANATSVLGQQRFGTKKPK